MWVMMVNPRFLRSCYAQNGTRIMSKRILTPQMKMVWVMVHWVRKWGSPLIRNPANLEAHSEARLPNAPESLEGGDVGLKFQLKMLEFMNSVNQELKRGKEERPL